MKVIASRGMGKTIFLITFLHSIINRCIVKYEDVYIFCPTFNDQNQWISSSFIERNYSYLNKEYAKSKLLVFDDTKLDTTGNKLIATLFIRGRHLQATAHIEKANTDVFVLIPPFNKSTAQYYHEKFMPTLTAKSIWKLGSLAEEKAFKEDNPELRYLIINKFGDINMGYKYLLSRFEEGNYSIVEINYIGNDTKPNIDIDKSRLDIIPYDDNDDCLICCKCKRFKQWKLANRIKSN